MSDEKSKKSIVDLNFVTGFVAGVLYSAFVNKWLWVGTVAGVVLEQASPDSFPDLERAGQEVLERAKRAWAENTKDEEK